MGFTARQVAAGGETHNGDQCMFLDGPRARVQVEREAAKRNAHAGKSSPGKTDRMDKDLSDDVSQCERWVSQREEEIDACEENDEDGEQEPGPKGFAVSRVLTQDARVLMSQETYC